MCFCSQLPGKAGKSHHLPFSLNYPLFGTATGSFWPRPWCLAQQKQDLSCHFSASQQEPSSILLFCWGSHWQVWSPLQSWSSRLCHWLTLICTSLRCAPSEKMGAPTASMDAWNQATHVKWSTVWCVCMPWISPGKLQAWKCWQQQQQQEIGCVLVGLFVGREWCSVFEELCKLCLRCSQQPLGVRGAASRNVLLQLPPCWKGSVGGEEVAFHRKSQYMGCFMCTHKFYSVACWDMFHDSHVSSDGPSEWVPRWADLCLATAACMPQCASKHHYGIAQSSGKLGVFLHRFSPSIGLHSDPVQRFLVCRRSCVALVQVLLEARGRIVLDPCGLTHGLEQQRHTSFDVKFL